MKNKKVNLFISCITLISLYSCFWDKCPPSYIVGEVNLMSNPDEHIPCENQLTYYSENDTIYFTSEGLQVMDSIMDLSVFCKKKDWLEFYTRYYYQAKTKVYKKEYLSSDKEFSMEYFISLYTFPASLNDGTWGDTIIESDTLLFDVLYVEFKNINRGKTIGSDWATSLRTNPGLPYLLKENLIIDSVTVDGFSFYDAHFISYLSVFECDTINGDYFKSFPCLLVHEKGRGITAMKFCDGWYFLEKD